MTSVDDGPSSTPATEVITSPTTRVQPLNIIGMDSGLDNVIMITPQGIPISVPAAGVTSSTVLSIAPGGFGLPVTLAPQQLVQNVRTWVKPVLQIRRDKRVI